MQASMADIEQVKDWPGSARKSSSAELRSRTALIPNESTDPVGALPGIAWASTKDIQSLTGNSSGWMAIGIEKVVKGIPDLIAAPRNSGSYS
jgi:hypothetical protein